MRAGASPGPHLEGWQQEADHELKAAFGAFAPAAACKGSASIGDGMGTKVLLKHRLVRTHRVRFGLCIVLGAVVLGYQEAGASEAKAEGVDIDECLACHASPDLQATLPSGEPLYLTIDRILFLASTHGRLGYACVQCHTNISGFPHDPITAAGRRDFTLRLYTSCARCHREKYEATLDSVHARALAAGNIEAAVCTDCHNPHYTGPPDMPLSRIPQTCKRCHSQIYTLYQESVHGAALIGEGNPDVPSCIDCHGVHDVQGPSTSPFHLFSPQICARCHSDAGLMDRYGVSTDVFETYIADFHGTTVVLFEALAPDQETNKPVCVDCHGVHHIRPTDDPESMVIKENLLGTCQKCHPDATINFPSAWLKHYRPTLQHNSLVYFVDLFYKILIPTLVGGMLLFVVLDGSRRIGIRRRDRRHE